VRLPLPALTDLLKVTDARSVASRHTAAAFCQHHHQHHRKRASGSFSTRLLFASPTPASPTPSKTSFDHQNNKIFLTKVTARRVPSPPFRPLFAQCNPPPLVSSDEVFAPPPQRRRRRRVPNATPHLVSTPPPLISTDEACSHSPPPPVG